MNIPESFNQFLHVSNVIDDNPCSGYLIVCNSINSLDDPLVWKFCKKENNFIPIYSNEFGDCTIYRNELEESMHLAHIWITSLKKNLKSILFLTKTHTLQPWQMSKKIVDINNSTGIIN